MLYKIYILLFENWFCSVMLAHKAEEEAVAAQNNKIIISSSMVE